jgi:hypothetical protein|tara:strand:+ start:6243 stop:6842 length:600 start_codon:yes stop_codon:yes gene_type:complete
MMKRILNPNSSFSSPPRDETNEENLGTDGDENTNTNTSNNNNGPMTTSSKDGVDALLFPSEQEQTEEQLVSAIKDWNNVKPVVVLNTISSLCVIVLAQLMAFLSIPIGVIGLIACSVYGSELFRMKRGLGATVATVKMLSLVCVILDGAFAAVSLAIGTLYAGGDMVTTMVLMSSLFGAHGLGYWEMYKRAKEIGKILN